MKYSINDIQILSDDSITLTALAEQYPDEWSAVNTDLYKVFSEGNKDALFQYIRNIKMKSEFALNKIKQSQNNTNTIDAFLPQILQARIATLALSQYNLILQSGQESGKVRFNFWNGFILQKLLFDRGFTRKPASLKLFRLFWPLVTQKKILIPLVNKKGIYCFYSEEFITRIHMLIGTKKCVEIGAGDGTLSRFLKNAGTVISASDDYSWGKFIHYPDFVEKLSARQTIEKYKPEVVICSWPPPWNDFEKFIFSDDTVKLYIVIGSTNEFASGNRQAYSRQKTFFMKDDKELASLLLPPDVQHAVYLFTKKDKQGN